MKYSFKRLQKWAILGIFVALVFSCKSTSVIKSGTVDDPKWKDEDRLFRRGEHSKR